MVIIGSFWLLKRHYLHHTAPPKAQERLVLALGHLGCAHSGRALRDGNGRAQLRLYLSSTKHAMLGEAGGGPWYAMILAGFLKTHWMAAVCPGIFVFFLRIRWIRLASSAAKAWFLGYLRWAIVPGNGWRVVCGCCYIMACHVRSWWALSTAFYSSRITNDKVGWGPSCCNDSRFCYLRFLAYIAVVFLIFSPPHPVQPHFCCWMLWATFLVVCRTSISCKTQHCWLLHVLIYLDSCFWAHSSLTASLH